MENERTSHKWTSHETNLFCEILADLENNFIETLQRGALKRYSAVKYLIPLLLNLKRIFSSKKKNQKNFRAKKKETKLLVKVQVNHTRLMQTSLINIRS